MKIYVAFNDEFNDVLLAVKWFARAASANGAIVPQALETLAAKMIAEGSRMRPRPEALLRLVRNAHAIATRDISEHNPITPIPIKLEWEPFRTELTYEEPIVDSHTPSTRVRLVFTDKGSYHSARVQIYGSERVVLGRYIYAEGDENCEPTIETIGSDYTAIDYTVKKNKERTN